MAPRRLEAILRRKDVAHAAVPRLEKEAAEALEKLPSLLEKVIARPSHEHSCKKLLGAMQALIKDAGVVDALPEHKPAVSALLRLVSAGVRAEDEASGTSMAVTAGAGRLLATWWAHVTRAANERAPVSLDAVLLLGQATLALVRSDTFPALARQLVARPSSPMGLTPQLKLLAVLLEAALFADSALVNLLANAVAAAVAAGSAGGPGGGGSSGGNGGSSTGSGSPSGNTGSCSDSSGSSDTAFGEQLEQLLPAAHRGIAGLYRSLLPEFLRSLASSGALEHMSRAWLQTCKDAGGVSEEANPAYRTCLWAVER